MNPYTRISHRPHPNRGRGQRGLALVLVLWVGTLLGVIVTAFAFDSRTEATLAANMVSRAQAVAIAEAGVMRAALGLMDRRSETGWSADGRVHEVPFGGHVMRVSVTPESGKIDLNAAPPEVILGLFSALADTTGVITIDEAQQLSDAILDWRDVDSSVRPLGAEDEDYAAAGYAYGAADRRFLTISELNEVMGMTPAVFKAVSGSITIHTEQAKVDPIFATRLVLLALPDTTPEMVEEFLSARDQALAEAAVTGDPMPRVPLDSLAGARRHLSIGRARTFNVRSEGRLRDGTVARRRAVIQTVRAARVPYSVLAWYEEFEPGVRLAAAGAGIEDAAGGGG